MTDYLYHGSAVKGIDALRSGSILHGTERQVVYLTDNIPYALLYIWDLARTNYSYRHVTAWIQHGTAQYEEQFSGQLKAFYQGASGWLYRVAKTGEMAAVKGREGLFCSPVGASVAGTEYVPNVYEALLGWEAHGLLKVWRFEERSQEEREELTNRVVRWIIHNGFFQGQEEAAFYRHYFTGAWEQAKLLSK